MIGRALPPGSVAVARLPGHLRRGVAGKPYPTVVPRPGGRVAGLLLRGLTPDEAARLRAYEGPEYAAVRRSVRVLDGEAGGRRIIAWVFVTRPHVPVSGRPWSLSEWRRRWKAAGLSGRRRPA